MPEYIDRAVALEVFNRKVFPLDRIHGPAATKILEDIAPAADVEPVVHAHWERRWADNRPEGWGCTNPKCGALSCCKGTFCPNCGAKMDEEV